MKAVLRSAVSGRAWAAMAMRVSVVALAIGSAMPAGAAVTVPLSTVEEIAIRQSVGIESAYFGPAFPTATHGNSVTVHGAMGAYASDGILGALSAVWHTSRVLPWNAAVSVGALDLDVNTWTVSVSSAAEAWRSGRSSLALEGVAGYQFFVQGGDDYTAFWLGDEDFESGDEAIVDSFRLLHGMIRAVYSLDLKHVTPMVDLGGTVTGYWMNGHVWDGSWPVTEGEARSENGVTGNISLGAGLSLGTDPLIVFGGMKLTADAVFFQANVGFAF